LEEPVARTFAGDACFGRKDGILVRRKEAKRKILQARKEYNQRLRELDRGNSTG